MKLQCNLSIAASKGGCCDGVDDQCTVRTTVPDTMQGALGHACGMVLFYHAAASTYAAMLITPKSTKYGEHVTPYDRWYHTVIV